MAQEVAAEGRRGARRGDILKAARARFVQDGGYAKATMADIARDVGVAEGTVYLYFASKRELVIEVAVDWFSEITERTARELAAIHTPLDRLRFLVLRHFDVILDNPELYLMFLREVRATSGYRRSPGRVLNRRYTDLLKETLAEAGATADGLPPATLRDLVYGGVEHVCWSAIHRGEAAILDRPAMAAPITEAYARAFGLAELQPIDDRLRRIEEHLGLDEQTEAE